MLAVVNSVLRSEAVAPSELTRRTVTTAAVQRVSYFCSSIQSRDSFRTFVRVVIQPCLDLSKPVTQ